MSKCWFVKYVLDIEDMFQGNTLWKNIILLHLLSVTTCSGHFTP